MERKYCIWDIDEMPEAELQELFPSEESGRQYKAEVLRFLHSKNLLDTQIENPGRAGDFEKFVTKYKITDGPLVDIIYPISLIEFNVYANNLPDEQLLEKLHNFSGFAFATTRRAWEGRISLAVVLRYNGIATEGFPHADKDFVRRYVFKFLMEKELMYRTGTFGSYFDLLHICLDYINSIPNIDVILLVYGTDKERDTINFKEKDVMIFLHSLFYGRKAKIDAKIHDVIRYLYNIPIDLHHILLYIDIFYNADEERRSFVITRILDFIGYDEELISKLTNPEIIEIINGYFSQI